MFDPHPIVVNKIFSTKKLLNMIDFQILRLVNNFKIIVSFGYYKKI